MVAVFTGAGLGVERGSGFVLGSNGQLGASTFGRYGENVYVNAATGNLAVQRQDELLIGRGLDDNVSRSYNSLGALSDDNGDNWQLSQSRRVTGLTGTVNTAGSTITRYDWDGSDIVYSWDATRTAYVAKQGAGPYDTLTYAANVWTWTDGGSRQTETYDALNGGRITQAKDADGNALSFTYTGNLLTRVTTANGERTDYSYTGNNLTQVVTTRSDATTETRVRYTYDAANRLSTVTTDLSPTDNSVADGNSVTTTYTYDGTSARVATIGQTGGASLSIAYTLVGTDYRVATLTQAQASGASSTTSFSYDTTNRITTITDAQSNVTKMTYDTSGNLTKLEQPAPVSGGATLVSTFAYNANGDVTAVTDQNANQTVYIYDSNGNLLSSRDAAGNTVTYTYDTNNNRLTETHYLVPDPDGAGTGQPGTPVTSRYAYDTESHLRYTVSDEGRVSEYQYDTYGRVVASIDYTDTFYATGSLAPTDAIAESTLNTWRSTLPDSTAAQLTETVYDARGNVSTIARYISLNVNRIRYAAFSSGTTGWKVGTDPNGITNGTLASGTTSGKAWAQAAFTATAAGQTASIAIDDTHLVPVTNLERLSIQAGVQGTGAIGTLQLVVHWYDSAGTELSQSAIGSLSGPQAFGTPISAFVQVPSGAAKARLELIATSSAAGTGTVALTQPMIARASLAQTVMPKFNSRTTNNDDMTSTFIDGTGTYDRTYYTYDQSGNLLNVHDSRTSATQTYIYDGLNRVIGSTDLAGATTSIAFTDTSNTSVVTASDLSTTTSVYDLAGELISASLAGSGVSAMTTTNAYDSLGRLRMVTNALGQKTYFLYDNDGQKVADITADGALTEYGYDAGGRVQRTIQYATKLTSTQIASLVDANGKPTNVTLASLRPAANAADSWSWNVCDHADRLIETINAVGSCTVYAYDGNDRLVSTTAYAVAASANAIAFYKTTQPTTLQLPVADPVHDRVSRSFYGDDGLLVGTLDADGALTQITYDAAGEKVRTVAFATLPSSTLRASGTFAQLLASSGTSAADRQTDYVYDAEGQLRYTIEDNSSGALGTGTGTSRLTEYLYDLSGNLLHTVAYGATIPAPAGNALYSRTYVVGQISTLGLAANTATRTSRSVYDNDNRLAFSIDAAGDVTQFVYDAAGRLTKTVAYATIWTGTIDAVLASWQSWATTNATNANNRASYTLYDAVSRPVYQVDAEGFVTESQYDALGRVVKTIRYADRYAVTDATTTASLKTTIGTPPSSAIVTTKAYDTAGRLTDVTDGVGAVTHYAYDALDRVTDVTLANGTGDAATTHADYDNAGRVAKVTTAYGTADASVTAYTYDTFSNLLSKTAAYGSVDAVTTNYAYDALGQRIKATDPTGAITQYGYDAFGNEVTVTDPRGSIGYNYYDQLDRLVLQIDPMGYATATSYSLGSAVTSVTHYATAVSGTPSTTAPPAITTNSTEDATTSFTLDKLDRVTKVTDALGKYEQYTLDAFGDRLTVRNKLGGVTTNVFDHRGQLISETLPQSSVNSAGTTVAVTVTNTYSYDLRGNRLQMIEADHGTNASGATVSLAERRTTTYGYDKMGRLTSTTHDAVNVTSSITLNAAAGTSAVVEYVKYDLRGNVIEQKDAVGARTLFYYDDNDRKIAQITPTGTYSTWTYDDNGNALTATTYGDLVTLPANAGGTPPAPVNGSNYRQTVYTYDDANRLSTTTIANILTGAFNGTSYATATSNLTSSKLYDATGNVVRTTAADGANSFFFYDKNGRKVAEVDPDNYLTTWALDADGNVTSETRYATALTDTVAAQGQSGASDWTVLQAHAAGGSLHANDRTTTFTYDLNGNRKSETRTGLVAWKVDAGTGALTQDISPATVNYTYNEIGEVASKQEATGDTTNYYYDPTGRLTSVYNAVFNDSAGNMSQRQVTSNFYDGLGNLVRTTISGSVGSPGTRATTYSYGLGGRLASTTDADGNTTTYGYDLAGRTVKASYTRTLSSGSSVTEAQATRYDLEGRMTFQAVASLSGSTWSFGDSSQTQYDAYGEVSAKGTNGQWQQTFAYDAAGRVARAGQADGTTQLFVYDKTGNTTLTIASVGADLSSQTVAGAINLLTGNNAHAIDSQNQNGVGMTVTIGLLDKRGQQTQSRQPYRDLTASNTQTLVASQAYNAFGEVIQTTNANGGVTDYAYNSEGKLIGSQAPTASWTSDNGTVSSARATQTNYYDLSGRLVGVRDANGNLNTLLLRAGTGHDGDDADRLKEFHADGGIVTNSYDVFGDMHTQVDEIGKTETYLYDGMDRLVEQDHQPRADGTQLKDHYVYDQLGQRTQHWNSQLGSGIVETTDYDAQGRVTKMVDLGGDATSYAYYDLSYQGAFTGVGKATTNTAGLTENEYFDIYGRETSKTDFGGNTYNDSYDNAGRKILETNSRGENVSTTYYNTGLTATITSGDLDNVAQRGSNYITTYGYDKSGNEISENYRMDYWAGYTTPVGGSYWLPATYTFRNATTTWDANNRMLTFHDDGDGGTNPASLTWEYDLAGNVRHTAATYRDVNSGNTLTQDYWYKYDGMNRFVTTKGILWGTDASGTVVTGDAARGIGSIARGYTGRDIVYNAANERIGELQTVQGGVSIPYGGYIPEYYEQREIYTYTEDGYLAGASMSTGAVSYTPPTPTAPLAAAPAIGTSQSQYTRDAMGRVTAYTEAGGYSRTDTYNAKSEITGETVSTPQNDGTTLIATTAYDYLASTTPSTWNGTTHGTYNGAYLGGVVTHTLTANSRRNTDGSTTALATSETESQYTWWDKAEITHKGSWPDVNSIPYTSDYSRDATGQLFQLLRNDATSGVVDYIVDAQNHVSSRKETATGSTATAIDYSYFFGGVMLGRTGNNGPDADDYALAVGQLQAQQTRSGPFQNVGPQPYANFDESYDPINPVSQAQTAGTYTVVDGDTLGSIAQTVWGDSSLWYLIADANGLSGTETLTAGRDLKIPSKVTNIHNNASTYRVYDPNQAQGPTEPIPPATPPSKHHGCGILGQILMVVIAVAVTIVTTGAAVAVAAGNGTTLSAGIGAVLGTSAGAGVSLSAGAAIAAGTAGAAAGSIISQGIGVATGLQDHFSWGSVGLSALTAFLGPVPVGKIGGSAFLGNVVGGALTNLAVQGIATAVGLQNKFDWAGVAVAGIASGTGQGVARTSLAQSLGNFGGGLVSGMAGAIAGAAARSLVTGTDFGDNIVRVLPDVIGQTVGNLVADSIAQSAQERAARRAGVERSAAAFKDRFGDTPEVAAYREAGLAAAKQPDSQEARANFDQAARILLEANSGDAEVAAFLNHVDPASFAAQLSDITINGRRDFLFGSTIDNAGIWVGEEGNAIKQSVGQYIQDHPGVGVALTLADGAFAVIAPGKYLAGKALDYFKDEATASIADMMTGPQMWSVEKGQAAGSGFVLAGSIALGGLGALKGVEGLDEATKRGGARFGVSTSTDYRATFFEANPGLEGLVVVHHAVEKQVLDRFPGVVTESEIHSLENLRGIPDTLNSDLHLSKIRIEWNRFYKPFEASGTAPTKAELLQKATEIDAKYGTQFKPPR